MSKYKTPNYNLFEVIFYPFCRENEFVYSRFYSGAASQRSAVAEDRYPHRKGGSDLPLRVCWQISHTLQGMKSKRIREIILTDYVHVFFQKKVKRQDGSKPLPKGKAAPQYLGERVNSKVFIAWSCQLLLNSGFSSLKLQILSNLFKF